MNRCKHEYFLLGIVKMTIGAKHMSQCRKCMKIILSDALVSSDGGQKDGE